MNNNNRTITQFNPDGSIKSVSKDGIVIFRRDAYGNIGIGDVEHQPKMHIHAGSGTIKPMTPEQFEKHNQGLQKEYLQIRATGDALHRMKIEDCSSLKLIIETGTIHKEIDPIGCSKPMERLTIQHDVDYRTGTPYFIDKFTIDSLINTTDSIIE
jgi:hypothetical protein